MKPLRVLSLNGGGMRGTYTATFLSCLAADFAKKRGVSSLDVGAAFDLIVGTSTGAIIACFPAADISLSKVVNLYRQHGQKIFPKKLPDNLGLSLLRDLFRRPKALKAGAQALSNALSDAFATTTVAEVYARRGIALAVPAVDLAHHHSWVFKTPHNVPRINHRDDDYTLADVCLATSAVPIFRSLAAIASCGAVESHGVFADGGLWANNLVLVGLIEALEIARDDVGRSSLLAFLTLAHRCATRGLVSHRLPAAPALDSILRFSANAVLWFPGL